MSQRHVTPDPAVPLLLVDGTRKLPRQVRPCPDGCWACPEHCPRCNRPAYQDGEGDLHCPAGCNVEGDAS